MLQTKFVKGTDITDLNEKLNRALSETTSEKTEVKYFLDDFLAIIEYELHEVYKDRYCSECAYWDGESDRSSLACFCTMTGKRMRYNCHACVQYKDIRG